MQVVKMDTEKKSNNIINHRPNDFQSFIGQKQIKKVLNNAIFSSKKRWDSLGHILFSGDSGFGKTTLAHIVSENMKTNIKVMTAYAIDKPADMITVLNQLEENDLLFIDEIHRLKPKIEEMLYIAMEDFRIDMVMGDGEAMGIPLNRFTLIGATTKLENLSEPLKNRFVYKFHFQYYTDKEKEQIVSRYLSMFGIQALDNVEVSIAKKVQPVPREIKNFCIKIRDWLISTWFKEENLTIDKELFSQFAIWIQAQDEWLSDLQNRYMKILEKRGIVGLSTLSQLLWVSEKVIEKDIEPMLLNLGKIEKGMKGRELK